MNFLVYPHFLKRKATNLVLYFRPFTLSSNFINFKETKWLIYLFFFLFRHRVRSKFIIMIIIIIIAVMSWKRPIAKVILTSGPLNVSSRKTCLSAMHWKVKRGLFSFLWKRDHKNRKITKNFRVLLFLSIMGKIYLFYFILILYYFVYLFYPPYFMSNADSLWIFFEIYNSNE